MVASDELRARFVTLSAVLDERQRRLFAATEAPRANDNETPDPREFRLEGAEGSPRTCPCSSHRSMPRRAPLRTEAVGRRSWRRPPRRHRNCLIDPVAGRSPRKTSCASWPRLIAPLKPVASPPSCVARGSTPRPSPNGAGCGTPGPSVHWFQPNAARRPSKPIQWQPSWPSFSAIMLA
jgi:hypothetical protein